MSLLCSHKCANRPQTSSPAPHQHPLEARRSSVMDILQPEAVNDLQCQRKEQQDGDTSGHPKPSLSNEELTSFIISMAHSLAGLQQEVNELKLPVTQLHSAQREMTPNICKDGDRTEQPKEITGLQEAWTAAGHREQLENATKQDLERELFHTKTLLKTANVELKERDAKVKALEGSLHAARADTQVPDLPREEAMDGSILILQTPQDLQQQAATTSSSTPFTQQPSRGCTRTTGHACIRPTGASNASVRMTGDTVKAPATSTPAKQAQRPEPRYQLHQRPGEPPKPPALHARCV
ncbi:hypothetical protein DPX16_10924 [Anabarilius grahami]|uniref:Uncharacterized protein n=1 Tax=Anabarilius grahami TaxID=495550 RepID=A0A3N0XTY3_ANAGA|nr:hypothetical protein DPX16_10924 [Anabarilius grahami]